MFSSHALNCFVPYLTLFLRHIFPHYFQHQRALLTIGLLHKIYCLMVGMHNLKINNIKLLNCLDKNFHYQNDLSWNTLTLSSTAVHSEKNCYIFQDISGLKISKIEQANFFVSQDLSKYTGKYLKISRNFPKYLVMRNLNLFISRREMKNQQILEIVRIKISRNSSQSSDFSQLI